MSLFYPAKLGLSGGLIRFQDHKLVFQQLRAGNSSLRIALVDCFHRNSFFLEIFKGVLRHIDLSPAPVLLFLSGNLLRNKILRLNPQHLRFYPQQNILGHQHHRICSGFRKSQTHPQDPVIHFIFRKILRQAYVHKIFFHPESASAAGGDSLQQIPPLA